MSRAGIRSAVTDFFSDPPVSGLSFVTPSTPRRTEASKFYDGLPLGSLSGCGAVVQLRKQAEVRAGIMGAHGGGKWRTYDVVLRLSFRSRETTAQAAEDDADVLLDAICDRFHADRTMGDRVFQAGEGPGPDIVVLSNPGKYVADVFQNTYEVRFVVREYLANT